MKIVEYLISRVGAVGRALKDKRYVLPGLGVGLFTAYGILQNYINLPDFGAFWLAGSAIVLIVVFACADRIIELENPSPLEIKKIDSLKYEDGWHLLALDIENTSSFKTIQNVRVAIYVTDLNGNLLNHFPFRLAILHGPNKGKFTGIDIDPNDSEKYILCSAEITRQKKLPNLCVTQGDKDRDLGVDEAIFSVQSVAKDTPKKKWKFRVFIEGKTLKGRRIMCEELDVTR